MFKLIQVTIFIIICDKMLALPYDVEKCRINDEKCLIRSSNKVLKKYYGGITEIDLQSLDPFVVDKIKVVHDYGVIRANGTVYNINLKGFSSSTIEKFSGFDQNLLEINFKTPKFNVKGWYSATGSAFGFPTQGEGVFTLNFYDFDGKLKIKLERYTRNGKMYFRAVGSDITSTVRTGDIDVTSLSRSLVWLLNQGFDTVLKSSIKSHFGDIWTKNYVKKTNSVLSKVPIDELFFD